MENLTSKKLHQLLRLTTVTEHYNPDDRWSVLIPVIEFLLLLIFTTLIAHILKVLN